MRNPILFVLAMLLMVPATARADLHVGDFPSTSTWYLHIDFKEMRETSAGSSIYEWLDDEVFEEIDEDTGVDLAKQLDTLTAYSVADASPVILLQGAISSDSSDKLMALAAEHGEITSHKARGKTYQFFKSDEGRHHGGNIDIDSFDDGVYVSFALKDKIILTPSRDQMEDMLANNGRIAGSRSHEDALFVLSAERNLLQAGADTSQLAGNKGNWNSKFLRNTRQLALLIADVDGKIAIDARLEAAEPGMINSLANIARGLIGLAAFSDDMEPEVAELLRGIKIGVKDNVLKFSLAMDPDAFVAVLDN